MIWCSLANNQNLAKANPARRSFLFSRNQTKMGDYPGSGYKMSSYGLKVYNPQETVGQWTQSCKVYYTWTEKLITTCRSGFAGGLPNKANFRALSYVSARRRDQKESYCHNRRRRGSGHMESGETKILRSTSRHQLFSCQDLGMSDVNFFLACLWILLCVELKTCL